MILFSDFEYDNEITFDLNFSAIDVGYLAMILIEDGEVQMKSYTRQSIMQKEP